ncbi:hypothetical protein E2C01_028981 [Portunus trituberculatus]|uniref:Uncharacterized protein n=1 Tax=Portunus trituberculatus TaxID=210409 RepID=A0A5B7EQQ8_PORTR|nr:hypothetical protein [Portunus trituberculatus]
MAPHLVGDGATLAGDCRCCAISPPSTEPADLDQPRLSDYGFHTDS